MAEKEKERQSLPHGDGDGDEEEIEIQLRFSGEEKQTIKVKRGTRLKDLLKSRNIAAKGLTFYFQGKKLTVNEETGELEDNPELVADGLLEILRQKVIGG